jgi:uncharacterized protein
VTVLLDANVLIALVVDDHVHHGAAERWLGAGAFRFATCPLTQGSLVRLLLREGRAASAAAVIGALGDHTRHVFWPDSLSYRDVTMRGLGGHRQVTDAYLAALARAHSGSLATFDRGVAAFHADVAELVPLR